MSKKNQPNAAPNAKKGRKRVNVKGEPIEQPKLKQGWNRAVGSGDFFKFDETGKNVEGIVVDITANNKRGKSEILTLRTPAGDVKLSFTKSIADKFEKHEIVIGDAVCITLLAVVNLDGGRTFKDMDVMYKKG